MSNWAKTKVPGVRIRHANACRLLAGASRCTCTPSYRGEAWNPATKKPAKSPMYADMNEAVSWLADFKRGKAAMPSGARRGEQPWPTFREAATDVLDGIEAGRIGTRGKRREFSDRTLASYRSVLRLHVYDLLGNAPVNTLTIQDWQGLIDRLARQGKSTSTIANVLMPVRTVYRYLCSPTRARPLPINPTRGLELPAKDEKKRMRIAPPAEAAELLAALKIRDRVPYAMAVYAGMRRKEIRHATWEWVDFEEGSIQVGVSKAGTDGENRRVPLVAPLRAILLEWWSTPPNWRGAGIKPTGLILRPQRAGDSGLVSMDMLLKRAYRAWDDAGLERIGLHDCRHTFASYLIAAGVNAKAISTYMGHSSIEITFDRYGHLFPGNTTEATGMLDAWMAAQSEPSLTVAA